MASIPLIIDRYEPFPMKNPWTKKNPLMSLWLSGANRIGNTARVRATAAVRRQTATLASDATKQVIASWTAAPAPKKPAAKARKKR